MKKAKIWYVIADGGKARFVERDEKGAFRTVVSFVSTELHAKSSDLGRDRPARVMESVAHGRSAVEPRRDLKEAAEADFVKLVAEEIDAGYKRKQFDRLVLVAPAGALTELKKNLDKPLAKIVVNDLQKDLTNVPDHELTRHLVPS
ncbi:MAG TPA: host attachment protein [Methyloceanibacter sp.]|jgi:protein required for attachment to host cells|nr:host attachment protein [Methyloceanibacter sp.]